MNGFKETRKKSNRIGGCIMAIREKEKDIKVKWNASETEEIISGKCKLGREEFWLATVYMKHKR